MVTVFAGVPFPGFLTALDRARGGAESAEVMHSRRADDESALAIAARRPIHLGLLDVDYRAFADQDVRAAVERDPGRFIETVAAAAQIRCDLAEVTDAIRPLVEDRELVYLPASIGGHPDHRDVALAGLRLAAPGREIRLYADVPYLFRHGLPTWLGRRPNPLADAQAASALDAVGWPGADEGRRVVELDAAELEAKSAAMHRYRTEYPLVNADFGGIFGNARAMRYEVVWCMVRGGR